MSKLKRVAILAMALLMTLSVAACGGSTTTSSSEQPDASDSTATTAASESETATSEEATDPGKVVTLQVFSMPCNTSGVQENKYWTEILLNDLGVILEFLPAGDQGEQKLQSLMASGDLPDITIFKEYKQVVNAVQANLLVNLDEHQDKLPNVFANAGTSAEYYRDNVSNGTGVCYSVGNNVTKTSATVGSLNFGPYLRWDYYKELGMPEIASLQDYLPVLKQMMEAHPQTEDGQKVYAMSMWSDWDGLMMQQCENYINLSGAGTRGYQELNFADNTMTPIFSDDSLYKEALQWLFDANQMGLIDPDSMSQRWNDYVDKATAGRILWSWWPWATGNFHTAEKEEQGIGFRAVFFENEKMESGGGPVYVGNTWSYSISSSTEHLDKCLAFMDYMYSYDGLWKMRNGEQAVYWDNDDAGEPYVTELGWDMELNNKEFPNGGKINDGLSIINSYGLHERSIHPIYGGQINREDWIKKDFAPQDTALKKDWKETMGAADDLDYLTQHNLYVEPDFAPMDPPTDDIEQINARIADVVKTYSWQIVFSNSQEEFDSLWAEMVKKAYGMNAQDSLDWYESAYKTALDAGSKYMK
ncbi:MAG: hypothetical protein ACK5LX_09330 [Oscillospiraceae bacterium]